MLCCKSLLRNIDYSKKGMSGDVKDLYYLEVDRVRHIIRIVALAAVVVLSLNVAIAEQIVYSERCLKTRQAEHAIQEKYQIVPEMYTFFVRNITESDNGTITVTLRGQDIYYWVLGTYIGSSDGKNTAASWSNEGKQTYGGFDAPAWEALQLHQMVELARKDHDTRAFYPQAAAIARRDPDYTELRPEDPMLFHEHEFEMAVSHPDHDTIEQQSSFTREQLNNIATTAIAETYGLNADIAAKICEVDSEPDFRYEIKNGQLIYHAWLGLQQSTEEDSDGFIPKLEHDGQYLVIINAETGIVEDVVYDALLPGAG